MEPNGRPIDIFTNSSNIQILHSTVTVAGSQSKIIFRRDDTIDPTQRTSLSPDMHRQNRLYPPSYIPQAAAPFSQNSNFESAQEIIHEREGISLFASSANISMTESDVSAIMGSQHVLIIPNQINPNMVAAYASNNRPTFAADRTTGSREYVSQLNETEDVVGMLLPDAAWASGECQDQDRSNPMGRSDMWISQSCGASQGNEAEPHYRPLLKTTHMPEQKKRSMPSRQTTSAVPTLGEAHILDRSVNAHLDGTSAFRTGMDASRVHYIHQAQPGAFSNRNGGTSQYGSQDPRSLIQDERHGSQRADVRGRDVYLLSDSQDADIRDTTFHVTDRSEGAIELPSRPTLEYIDSVKAILSMRSGNTMGANPSATPGAAVLSMHGPSQPPYVTSGQTVPGYHQPPLRHHPTQSYSANHQSVMGNSTYPSSNYYPPPLAANYAAPVFSTPMNTSGYNTAMAHGLGQTPSPAYPHTSGQSRRSDYSRSPDTSRSSYGRRTQ